MAVNQTRTMFKRCTIVLVVATTFNPSKFDQSNAFTTNTRHSPNPRSFPSKYNAPSAVRRYPFLASKPTPSSKNDDQDSIVEVISDDNEDMYDLNDQDWISDADLIQRATRTPGGESLTNRDRTTMKPFASAGRVDGTDDDDCNPSELSATAPALPPSEGKEPIQTRSAYSDEEEELIRAMGGRKNAPPPEKEVSSRRDGYLGDCTLSEISRDYAVPVCYLADVICGWGAPPPIEMNDRLGDLVTGEQAFALVEALYTLDNGDLNDRYSDDDLATICDDFDIDIREAFQFCMTEKYNLPFGVRTFLRVEQEEELIRVLSPV
eukprot:CAMPEP_0195513700 /NCGR_PEP_ID=MMETSP0794_2-20130614/5296_1 /TAXON_ID=515487 /ORGANISM="Stephanopyxis turris, Strain CCMP 815" /LENGTH=320 /DNA_ID=CAMNT_0040641781 /DNA_START=52 /DNA_END=1014 /DNA_ORIENTATION=-